MLIIVLEFCVMMRSCIDHLMALPHIAGPRIRQESEFLAQQLETPRHNGTITNEAFLDAGAVQGALNSLALIEMGVSQKKSNKNYATLSTEQSVWKRNILVWILLLKVDVHLECVSNGTPSLPKGCQKSFGDVQAIEYVNLRHLQKFSHWFGRW